MERVFEKFNQYIVEPDSHWRKRLTWMGLDGISPKHSTSILKFNEETNIFSYMSPMIEKTIDFFKEVDKLADEYVNWVKSKNKGYTNTEYGDMHKFFVGAIGEVFDYFVFENKTMKVLDEHNVVKNYCFENLSPTLINEFDFGVDFTGYANGVPSVFQVKFWNPFSKKSKITIDVIQKLYSEGIVNNFVDNKVPNNMFICCLQDEKTIYDMLKKTNYIKNVVVIGMNAFKLTVDDDMDFWDLFRDRLSNLK